VKSSTYRSATTKCTGKVIRQTNIFKLYTVLLFVDFTATRGGEIVRDGFVFVGEGAGKGGG